VEDDEDEADGRSVDGRGELDLERRAAGEVVVLMGEDDLRALHRGDIGLAENADLLLGRVLEPLTG
jgi:hypothetical protein